MLISDDNYKADSELNIAVTVLWDDSFPTFLLHLSKYIIKRFDLRINFD